MTAFSRFLQFAFGELCKNFFFNGKSLAFLQVGDYNVSRTYHQRRLPP